MFKKMVLFIMVISSVLMGADKKINHNVDVVINPATHFVKAIDKIDFPEKIMKSDIYFLLDKNLKVKSKTSGVKIILDKSKIVAEDFGMDVEDFSKTANISQNKYLIKFKGKKKSTVILEFSGKINYELKTIGGEYDRGFSQTPGLITTKGVYLAGSTYWVPWFNEDLITYELKVTLPGAWDVVSHGKRTLHIKKNNIRTVKWVSKYPAEEIFVIAAKFYEYNKNTGNAKVMAFLRAPDDNLANKYLETTAQYMELYRNLVGPFPYSKFALVENFWETGYGMPSFTLLGPKIIRFPFILHSSYPHELLHNYWGNSVYVDFKTGNWCEGITVYMADHMIKEQRGQGIPYRRDKLQRYTDYVTPKNDFPLSKFLARNSASSEAIGYGKSMMVMEMLRYKVGDKLFVKAFQKFNRDNKFKVAGFDDIRIAFEAVTGKDFKSFFKQWIQRTGAPELKVAAVSVKNMNGKYVLNFTIKQIQKEDVFELDIPVAFSFSKNIIFKNIVMNKRVQNFKFSFDKKPLVIQVDPKFNVFRKLNHLEIPPALSKIYGSENILVILPSKANKSKLEAYKKLATKWAKNKKIKISIKTDNEIKNLPKEKDIWILGHNNKFKNIIVNGISNYNAEILSDSVRLENTVLKNKTNSFVISVRHPNNPKNVIAWLTLENPNFVMTLARKLMHYGKYSYLAFQGKDVANSAKGSWPSVNSPLFIELEKNAKTKAYTKLPKRRALAYLSPVFSAKRMMNHIKFLASDKLKGRGLGTPGIEAAANYIAEQFKSIGLKPGGDNNTYYQKFETIVNAKGKKGIVKNIIGYIPGTDPKLKNETVVVSAHYDHLGLGWPDVRTGNKGKIHNGADDNASGISVMTELAQLLNKTLKPKRTILFIAFTAEENGLIGSKYFVKNYKKFPIKDIIGDINLDTVGRLGTNKVMVLNSASAREWKFIFMGAGYVTGVASQIVTQQITASDQKSFIEVGVPAVQIFSGPNLDYHTPEDDIEKIDSAGLIKIASFVREGVLFLADSDKRLTFTGSKGTVKRPVMKTKTKSRRASTGIMPDFGYSDKGVKVALVKENSAAFKAGLKKGDIIIKLGKYNSNNLREYSTALKNFQPGDTTTVTFIRNGKTVTSKITLSER